jgi:hypothetical protein
MLAALGLQHGRQTVRPARLQLGALRHEKLYRAQRADPGRHMQRRLAVLVCGLKIGAGVEKQPEHVDLVVHDGLMQGG